MRGIFPVRTRKKRVVVGNSSLGVLIEDGKAKGVGKKMMCFFERKRPLGH